MSTLDDDLGTPIKKVTAEIVPEETDEKDEDFCDAGGAEVEMMEQDFKTARELIEFAWLFAGYIADSTLTPVLTQYERESAARVAAKLKGFMEEVNPYYDSNDA